MKEVMGHCAHATSSDSTGFAGTDSEGARRVGYPRAVLVGASTRRGHAPVAQRIEHLTTDQKVGVSNTSGRATSLDNARPASPEAAHLDRACSQGPAPRANGRPQAR